MGRLQVVRRETVQGAQGIPGVNAIPADEFIADRLADETSDTYAAIMAGFMRGQVVTHPRWGAVGDGIANDTAAILACIAFVKAAGGGVVFFPEGIYLISSTLIIDNDAVTLQGDGGGYDEAGIADLRATAATRLVFSSSATPAPMVRFTSVEALPPRVGGGCMDMMLDGNNRATRCLELLSWRGGRFEDLCLYAATAEMLFTGVFSGTPSLQPNSTQFNRFIRITTSARNQTGNTAHAARLTGGQGSGATVAGNTSFNQFIACHFMCRDNNVLVLEDTDNNNFFGCSAHRDTGTGYSLVLSSADQDSSGSVLTGRHARFNNFYGCEFNDGIHARAGQTGNSSSFGNQFYGLNYSNGAPPVTYEAAAGGSAAAQARVYSSTAAELLNATKVAIGDTSANVGTARTNLGTESVRIKNGSSDHVRLESNDGLSEWQVSIHNPTGSFRVVRVSGSGAFLVSGGVLNSTMGDGSVGTGTFRDSVDARVVAAAAPQVTEYFTAQTDTVYNVPTGAKSLLIEVCGASGGGGSGRRGAAATVRCGGGGGAAGSFAKVDVAVAALGGDSTLLVTVGAGGTGGAAVTTDDTNGNAGGSGTASRVLASTPAGVTTTIASSSAGTGGAGGTATSGAAGAAGTGMFRGSSGGVASTTGLVGGAGVSTAPGAPAGGGAGGGITSGDVTSAGGAGGHTEYLTLTGLAGGAADGGAGANGAVPTFGALWGQAGSGGGSSKTTAGGNGGNGARGAGGGGGGASLNGFNSGAGGNGADGFVRITARFA